MFLDILLYVLEADEILVFFSPHLPFKLNAME